MIFFESNFYYATDLNIIQDIEEKTTFEIVLDIMLKVFLLQSVFALFLSYLNDRYKTDAEYKKNQKGFLNEACIFIFSLLLSSLTILANFYLESSIMKIENDSVQMMFTFFFLIFISSFLFVFCNYLFFYKSKQKQNSSRIIIDFLNGAETFLQEVLTFLQALLILVFSSQIEEFKRKNIRYKMCMKIFLWFLSLFLFSAIIAFS